MTVYIAQASCDERGRYVGGQAGNQSGTELNIRAYYSNSSNPWHCYRAKDATVAQMIAENASGAVGNMNIGYDQGERNTIRLAAQRANLVLAAIRELCECDCASLQAMCAICAGASDALLYAGGNLPWTGNAHAKILSTGLFTDMGRNVAESDLFVGDLLVRDGHAVIVVRGQAAVGAGSSDSVVVSGDIAELARAVIAGRYGNGDARRAALGDKFDAIQNEVNRQLSGTPNAQGTSTGSPRIIAGSYRVVCSSLNVRSTPSREHEPVAEYSRGEVINSIGTDVVEAEGYVWAHYTAYSGETRYVAIGTADGSEKYLVKL